MKNIFCRFGWHDKQVEQKMCTIGETLDKVESIITCKRCPMKIVDRWFDHNDGAKPKKVRI